MQYRFVGFVCVNVIILGAGFRRVVYVHDIHSLLIIVVVEILSIFVPLTRFAEKWPFLLSLKSARGDFISITDQKEILHIAPGLSNHTFPSSPLACKVIG